MRAARIKYWFICGKRKSVRVKQSTDKLKLIKQKYKNSDQNPGFVFDIYKKGLE
jgi:hypothetical protein